MFRIKICGITTEADARVAADAGADAVGLNFYEKSRRFVDPPAARRIADALPPGVMRVGVFVNHAANEIAETANQVGLDCIQLHGNEPPNLLATLPGAVKIVRAFPCDEYGLKPIVAYLEECRTLRRVPDAVLIDANAGADFGGTGKRADWERIANERNILGNIPMVLAGGLTPDNVAAAIMATRPSGVDVASGVEAVPGRKDTNLVRRFVTEARTAFARA
jgi:phosphoribosylanthranilate isomerase